jgi:hypothetical protein
MAIQAATAKLMAETKQGPKRGEVGKGRPADRCEHITPNETGRGTSADYLAARIKRDRPDVITSMCGIGTSKRL